MRKLLSTIGWMLVFYFVGLIVTTVIAITVGVIVHGLQQEGSPGPHVSRSVSLTVFIVLVYGSPLLALILGVRGILPGTRGKNKPSGKTRTPKSPAIPPIIQNGKAVTPPVLAEGPSSVHRTFTHEGIPDSFILGEDRLNYISRMVNSEELLEKMRQVWRIVATQFREDTTLADQLNLKVFKKDQYFCGCWLFPPVKYPGEAIVGMLVIGPLDKNVSIDWKTIPVRYFLAEWKAGIETRLLEWSPNGYQLIGSGPHVGDALTIFTDMVFDRIFGKKCPTAQQVAKRLLILKNIGIYIQTIPMGQQLNAAPDFKPEAKADLHSIFGGMFIKKLQEENLWDEVSPKERELLETHVKDVTQQQMLNASWRIEAAQVLMWALGLLPSLPPYDSESNAEILKQVSIPDPSEFIASAKLRDEKEIDQARKVAELWHWRSRTRQLQEEGKPFPITDGMKSAGLNSYEDIVKATAQIAEKDGAVPKSIGGDFPARGKAYRDLSPDEWSVVRSITMERHFTLNWICGYSPGNSWDNTPTDT